MALGSGAWLSEGASNEDIKKVSWTIVGSNRLKNQKIVKGMVLD
jgi:hypothetical protein